MKTSRHLSYNLTGLTKEQYNLIVKLIGDRSSSDDVTQGYPENTSRDMYKALTDTIEEVKA